MSLQALITRIALLCMTGGAAPAFSASEASDELDLAIIDVEHILASERLAPSDKLTRTFRTYTFFLFPSPSWLERSTSRATLEQLRTAFQRFGRAVGESNIAIWFRKASSRYEPDSERAAIIARAFKLDANAGPWIIYVEPSSAAALTVLVNQTGNTKVFKTSFKSLQDALFANSASTVVALNVSQISPECAVDILNQLQADLRLEQVARAEVRKQAQFCELNEGAEQLRAHILNAGKAVICALGVIKEIGVEVRVGPRRRGMAAAASIAFTDAHICK